MFGTSHSQTYFFSFLKESMVSALPVLKVIKLIPFSGKDVFSLVDTL